MDTNLSSILSNPALLSAVTDQDLKAWIEQYPYVPLFRLEQYKRDRTYDNALQASFRVHNRDILYQLLYNKETVKKEIQPGMEDVPVKEEVIPGKETVAPEVMLQAEEEIQNDLPEKEIHLDELQEIAEPGENEQDYTVEKNPADELSLIPEQDEVKFDLSGKEVRAGQLPVLPEHDEVKLDLSEDTANPEELPVTIPEPETLLPVVQQQVQHEEEKKPDAEHTIADDVLETIRKLWAEREKAKSEPEITKETGTGPKDDLLFQKTEEEKVFIPEVEEDVIEEHHEPEIITDKENIEQEEKVSEEVHEEISTEEKQEAEPVINETETFEEIEETEEKETPVESSASETEQNKEEAGKVVNTELPQNTEEEQKEKKSDDKIVQPWLEHEKIPQPEITENTGAAKEEETRVEEAKEEEKQAADSEQVEEKTEVEEQVEAEIKETKEEAVEEKTVAEKQASAEKPEAEIKEEEEKQAADSEQEGEKTEVEEQVEAENKETKEAVEETTGAEEQTTAVAVDEPEAEIKEAEQKQAADKEQEEVKTELAAEIKPPVVENEEVPQNTEEEQEAKKEAKAGITAESESGIYIPPVEVETPSQKSEPTEKETVKPPISTDEPHSIMEWISLLDGGIQVEKPFDNQPREEWIEIPRYEIEFQQQHKNVYTVEDFEGELDKKEDLDEDLNRMAGESVEFKQDMMTETLAQVYLKQGKPEKALSIYNTLRLKFPEKSAYFAALIEKIEKGE